MQKAIPAGRQGSATLLLVLLGLLVILAGGYFYFTSSNHLQTPVSPAISSNNKQATYTNQALGFKFEYGRNLTAKEDTEELFNKRGNGEFRKYFKEYVRYEPGKFAGAVAVLDQQASYDTNPFTVWVFENPNNLSIDNWYKNYWYYPLNWGDFTYKGKVELAPKIEATVSGQLGKTGVIDYQPGKPKFVYVSKDGKMYLFRVIGEEGEKVLSTFKFLK